MAPGAPTIMGKLPVTNGNFLLFLAKSRVAFFNYRSACAITGGEPAGTQHSALSNILDVRGLAWKPSPRIYFQTESQLF